MPQRDSDDQRELVCNFLPGLEITGVARPSGQRIVYFGTFRNCAENEAKQWGDDIDVSDWGDVVVKISEGVTPATITYLQREIRILSLIDSTHYPKMYFDDVCSMNPGTDEPLPERLFVTVEEFVPSRPLTECLEEFATEETVVSLIVQLAKALQILWDQNPPLVHRDIKPDNILIKDCGTAVIIDLGISREVGSDGVTVTEMLVGPCTPDYTSPEQARNDKRNISFKSDIFVLGILIHVLLTNTNPFRQDSSLTAAEVLGNITNLEPETLSNLIGASSGLSDLTTMMLHKEPYRRPRAPAKFIQSLIAIQEQDDAN